MINDLKVGNRSQFVSSGPIPAQAFTEAGVGITLRMDTAQESQDIVISVQNIAVAVVATGMTTADEGRLFRFTIKHSVFLMAVMGILSMLFAYVFSAYVPTV